MKQPATVEPWLESHGNPWIIIAVAFSSSSSSGDSIWRCTGTGKMCVPAAPHSERAGTKVSICQNGRPFRIFPNCLHDGQSAPPQPQAIILLACTRARFGRNGARQHTRFIVFSSAAEAVRDAMMLMLLSAVSLSLRPPTTMSHSKNSRNFFCCSPADRVSAAIQLECVFFFSSFSYFLLSATVGIRVISAS